IENRPIVERFAVRVLAVSVRRAPFERRRPVASSEQIMRSKLDLIWPHLAELADQLLAVLHVGVIRLISAEESPDGFQLAFRLGGVDTNLPRDRFACRRSGLIGSGDPGRPPRK